MKFFAEQNPNGTTQLLTFPDGRPLVCPHVPAPDNEPKKHRSGLKKLGHKFEKSVRHSVQKHEKLDTGIYSKEEVAGSTLLQQQAIQAAQANRPLPGRQLRVVMQERVFDSDPEIQALLKKYREKQAAPANAVHAETTKQLQQAQLQLQQAQQQMQQMQQAQQQFLLQQQAFMQQQLANQHRVVGNGIQHQTVLPETKTIEEEPPVYQAGTMQEQEETVQDGVQLPVELDDQQALVQEEEQTPPTEAVQSEVIQQDTIQPVLPESETLQQPVEEMQGNSSTMQAEDDSEHSLDQTTENSNVQQKEQPSIVISGSSIMVEDGFSNILNLLLDRGVNITFSLQPAEQHSISHANGLSEQQSLLSQPQSQPVVHMLKAESQPQTLRAQPQPAQRQLQIQPQVQPQYLPMLKAQPALPPQTLVTQPQQQSQPQKPAVQARPVTQPQQQAPAQARPVTQPQPQSPAQTRPVAQPQPSVQATQLRPGASMLLAAAASMQGGALPVTGNQGTSTTSSNSGNNARKGIESKR